MKLNFEKNLNHQKKAVDAVIGVFEDLEINKPEEINKNLFNPEIQNNSYKYFENIERIKNENGIDKEIKVKRDSKIIDIMMETGTGKTYTYTKTIFELNKKYGIFKFIIVVPTLAIKSGTINFLKSESSRNHFKEQYGKVLNLHIVESKKGGKSKKNLMPSAISSFVKAENISNEIQILLINTGMINSKTMNFSFDANLIDKYSIPFEALSATKSFIIIDEPHKFDKINTTWKNIEKMSAQFILRYGATFPEKEIKQKDYSGKIEKIKIKDYHNLVYTLTAIDSFNRNLVKGIIGHITEFESAKNILLKFVNSDGKEATFELIKEENKKIFKISQKESFEKIHTAMTDLFVKKLNKTEVILSNGLSLKKGDKINPYSYDVSLQEIMIEKAIKNHFKLEKKYLKREIKIKPLTLFFIDNIEEYRNKNGNIRKIVEKFIKLEAENLLKTEKNIFYKKYLEETLKDISKTHGGYFSKDNSEKDEEIEKEINEILHDKQAILDLKNPRRFIFSKWTLKEGWDNPNVFGICKLRGSGSEISRLQEVGRGLRLPVNQYGNRVKNEEFFLNYFVDFTENNFVDNLINEINEKSGGLSFDENYEKLTEKLIKNIYEKYGINEEILLDLLDSKKIIKRNNDFLDGGLEFIKKNYPLAFDGISSEKVKKSGEKSKKIKIRTEKYSELKELWEKINQKVILEYKIKNEEKFQEIFVHFLNEEKNNFSINGIKERKIEIEIENNKAISSEKISIFDNNFSKVSTMKYSDFLKELSKNLNINLNTIHISFLKSKIEINNFLNNTTIRIIKRKFNNYLMFNAIGKFEISYKKISNSIHPTFITNKNGDVKKEVNASNIGVHNFDEKVANNYLFEELFYDSELEKENIKTEIKEVIVFSKIPKNSIKIPISGGKTYSPDFAYVLDFKDGNKKLFFIVETKNLEEKDLRSEEKIKIQHAEKFFGDAIKIKFETQFNGNKIINLIKKINTKPNP